MFKTAAGLLVSLVLTASAAFAQPAATKVETGVAGHWEGKIDIPEHPMPMTLDLAKDAKGSWVGTMSVVGSTSVDVPLTGIAVDNSTVRFAAKLPEKADFECHVSDGNMSGSATSPQGSAPMQLTRNGEAKVNLPPPSTPLSKEFAGDWVATVERDGKSRRIGLKLAASSDGLANATLISIDRGNLEIPVQSVQIKSKELTLESRSVSGKFTGTLNPNGEIGGQWFEGQNATPLTFKRVVP